MKEITYKCDICKQKGNKDNLAPFYINSNGVMQFLMEMDNTNSHICNECIDTIYEYKEEQVEEKQEGE